MCWLRERPASAGWQRLLTQLHEALAARVRDWRAAGYRSAYPAIAEIFEHAIEGEITDMLGEELLVTAEV